MVKKFSKKNWEVFCTTRFKEKAGEIKSLNATPVFFDDEEKIESILSKNSYILSTAPPQNGNDPVIENYVYLFKKTLKIIKNHIKSTKIYKKTNSKITLDIHQKKHKKSLSFCIISSKAVIIKRGMVEILASLFNV